MVIIKILGKSLGKRVGQSLVSTLVLAFSITLLLVLGQIHEGVQRYARQLTSGTDLMIGAPSQPTHLVLYGLFRIGTPPPEISWSLFEGIANEPEVASAIPVSTNESHKGYTVTGSVAPYFKRLQLRAVNYISAPGQSIEFRSEFSAFIGSAIARELQYQPGESLTVARGASPGLSDEYPTRFLIQGVLTETGTSLDSNIIVSLEGLRKARAYHGLPPDALNFILVKLHSRQSLYTVQARLKKQFGSAVEVAIPAVELEQLGYYEKVINHVFRAMSFVIGLLALIMIFFNLSAGFAERKQEIELLRMVGARPFLIAGLALAEPVLQIMMSLLVGAVFYLLTRMVIGSWVPVAEGVELTFNQLSWIILLVVFGFMVACWPAWRIYGFSKTL